jgi:hypothetical protein
LQGRPRWFVKYALQNLMEELLKSKPQRPEDVMKAIAVACDSAGATSLGVLTDIVHKFSNKLYSEQRQFVISLYRTLLCGSPTFSMIMEPVVHEAMRAGVMALPSGQTLSQQLNFDLSAEPLLAEAVLAVGRVHLTPEEVSASVAFGFQSSETKRGGLGTVAEVQWALHFVLCAGESAYNVLSKLSAVIVPQWLKGYSFQSESCMGYADDDVYQVAIENPSIAYIHLHHLVGADVIATLKRNEYPIDELPETDNIDEWPESVLLSLQAKTGENAALHSAQESLLPQKQLQAASLEIYNAYVDVVIKHKPYFLHAVRVLACNRTLTAGAVTAVNVANKEQLSPFLVLVANQTTLPAMDAGKAGLDSPRGQRLTSPSVELKHKEQPVYSKAQQFYSRNEGALHVYKDCGALKTNGITKLNVKSSLRVKGKQICGTCQTRYNNTPSGVPFLFSR